MKQVLIIDARDFLRDFIKDKLISGQVTVHEVTGWRDAVSKLVSILPDLVIVDVVEDTLELTDFLKKKHINPNAKMIPVIILGPVIAKEQLAVLAQLGVVRYFNKPIRFDIFFESVGKILKTLFFIDTTPCIFNVHINNDIIFIEIARGLNREKISLLRLKISEIITANSIENPKAVVMMTDIKLSFIDGANLELLFDNLITDQRLQKRNIKVLAHSEFVRQFIMGHPQYSEIEIASDISNVLVSLVGGGAADDVDLVINKILSASEGADLGSVEMRFESESGNAEEKTLETFKVAVVDDEAPVREMLSKALTNAKAAVSQYADGQAFLGAAATTLFDLVILDIVMPRLNGIEVLKNLLLRKYKGKVLIYSKITQREAVMQTMKLGAKGYMVKPQTSETIIKKAIQILENRPL
jgi:DNA-binding response OmpR family regulator